MTRTRFSGSSSEINLKSGNFVPSRRICSDCFIFLAYLKWNHVITRIWANALRWIYKSMPHVIDVYLFNWERTQKSENICGRLE